ncbi:hypothetical protein L1987_06799 [Smallanthus sonchifolius]|uniref:Uncharacterized protein n=1 Tax=Smallanthus sonchifolius TaxID=185202 RepID=A0ACB9JZA3_9ASTR|nr:hypothetical protein L1987_06799 [Smallanthus sonchifolius]
MSKQTGPSYNTRGKRKQTVVENAAEKPNSRVELQKMITEGIKDSLPMIFTELEKRQADKLSLQPSNQKSINSQYIRTITQSKPVTFKPKGSNTHKTKRTEREEYYHHSSKDEGMGNNYGHIEKKRKMIGCTYKIKCAEKDKVLYASNLFKDQALEWWNNIVAAKGREVAYAIGWSAFKARVEKKYVPQNEREQIEGKFLSLKMMGTNRQKHATKLLEYA